MLNPQGTSVSQITGSQTFPSVLLPAYKQGYVLTSSLSPIKTVENCSLAAVSTPASCSGSSPKIWLKAFPERCNLGRGSAGKHDHMEKYASVPILCTTWSCDEKFQSSWSYPSTAITSAPPIFCSQKRLSVLQCEQYCLMWASLSKYDHQHNPQKFSATYFHDSKSCRTKRPHNLMPMN